MCLATVAARDTITCATASTVRDKGAAFRGLVCYIVGGEERRNEWKSDDNNRQAEKTGRREEEQEGTTTLSLLSPEDVPFAAERLSVSDRFGSGENYSYSHFFPPFC